MLKYHEGDLNVAGVRIHYYRTGGEKPPLILLHGATDNGLCWTRLAERLVLDYDIIMPDAQGHGLSDRLNADFSHQNHTDQVAALAGGLGIANPVIIGHSMGAGTAVNVAIRYPSLLRAIILEDPPWGAPPVAAQQDGREAYRPVQDFRSFLTGLRNLTLDEIVEASRKNDPTWAEDERLPWALAKQQFDASLFSRPVINQRSYAELVPMIDCPTLLISAENGIVTAEIAGDAARLWKSGKPFRWVEIKGAGHNIRRERFEDFFGAVTGFLSEIDG